MDELDENLDESFGIWEGECQGGKCFGPVNDLSLCLSWFSVKWNFPLLKNANVSGDSVPRPLGFLRNKR